MARVDAAIVDNALTVHERKCGVAQAMGPALASNGGHKLIKHLRI